MELVDSLWQLDCSLFLSAVKNVCATIITKNQRKCTQENCPGLGKGKVLEAKIITQALALLSFSTISVLTTNKSESVAYCCYRVAIWEINYIF